MWGAQAFQWLLTLILVLLGSTSISRMPPSVPMQFKRCRSCGRGFESCGPFGPFSYLNGNERKHFSLMVAIFFGYQVGTKLGCCQGHPKMSVVSGKKYMKHLETVHLFLLQAGVVSRISADIRSTKATALAMAALSGTFAMIARHNLAKPKAVRRSLGDAWTTTKHEYEEYESYKTLFAWNLKRYVSV